MNNIYQTTLSKPIFFKGIGLHTGKSVELTILPTDANTGIVFKRVDLKEKNIVRANYKNVKSATLCTTLENEFGTKVSTVEHLMAALYISEIDNAIVELDSEEVPIMDGSARDFLAILKKTKTKQLLEKRKYLKVLEEIKLIDGKKEISIEPCNSLVINFQLDYENKIIGKQKNIVDLDNDDLTDISNSRTFCLLGDIERIKKIGLAKGGSLDNAIVVDDKKILNSEGLRNNKEFVNHKILDLTGDFLLSEYRILGKVKCNQGGHELTNRFLRKLLSLKSAAEPFVKNQFKDQNKLKKYNQNQIIKLAASA